MTEPRPDHRPDMRRGRREDARFTSGRGRYCDDVKVGVLCSETCRARL